MLGTFQVVVGVLCGVIVFGAITWPLWAPQLFDQVHEYRMENKRHKLTMLRERRLFLEAQNEQQRLKERAQ